MIAQLFHVRNAARFGGAVRVRGSKVSRVLSCGSPLEWVSDPSGHQRWLTEDVSNCPFVLDDFRLPELAGRARESSVVKGVGCDLMTLVYHAFNHVRPLLGPVNLPLPVVIARNKEGRFGLVGCKDVQKIIGVLARAIIEGQGNGAFLKATPDALVIGHLANQWSCILGGVRTVRDSVAVTSTESLLAILRNGAVHSRIALQSEQFVVDRDWDAAAHSRNIQSRSNTGRQDTSDCQISVHTFAPLAAIGHGAKSVAWKPMG